MGAGNEIDYGMRVYDPRVGRFMSVDPLTKSYPWYTPYQFAGNKPILAVDLDGLEEWPVNNGTAIAKGPYLNVKAAQDAVSSGLNKALPPPAPSRPVQKKSTFAEVVGTLHTIWRIATADPTNPIESQPEATEPVGQIMEMTTPYIPYEKVGGAILNKFWPELIPSIRGAAGNAVKTIFTKESISIVTKHLEQFGAKAENEVMLKRMSDIAEGKLDATEIDKNFINHELREQELEATGLHHDAAHEQVLKEQGMYHRGYEELLYTKEALDAGNKQMEREATKKLNP